MLYKKHVRQAKLAFTCRGYELYCHSSPVETSQPSGMIRSMCGHYLDDTSYRVLRCQGNQNSEA